MIQVDAAYVIPFETTAAGLPVAADATPTAVLWRNGSAEPTAVVIVTTANTGIYHATFTTDDEWLPTDRLWLIVSATIDGDAFAGIVWDSFSESDSKAAIATAVAQYDQRDEEGTPGTIGWLFKKLRQANQAIEFVVTNDITPTTTTFSISLTAYDTSAFAHSVLLMLTGSAAEDNGVIMSYTNNGTYATIVLEKPMANAPSVGDEGLIRADSHVHSVAEIAAGVWGAVTSGYAAATGTFGYVVNALSTMIEYVGGVFRYKATSLSQAPTESGIGEHQITLVADSTGGQVPGVVFRIAGTVLNVTTGSSGEAILSLDAGSYTLRTVVPPGYEQVADQALVVAGDATVTVTVVATTVTISNPPLCSVSLPIVDQYGAPIAGVNVMIEFVSFDGSASPDAVVLSPPPVLTSDEDGLITVDLIRLGNYKASYAINGAVKRVDFSVPDAGSYVVVEPN